MDSMHLTLETIIETDRAIVRCTGKLVAGGTAPLQHEVKRLLAEHRSVVLDLTALAYMDSLGLGTVIGLYTSARASGRELRLINLSQRVRDMLRMTKVLTLLESCGPGGMLP